MEQWRAMTSTASLATPDAVPALDAVPTLLERRAIETAIATRHSIRAFLPTPVPERHPTSDTRRRRR